MIRFAAPFGFFLLLVALLGYGLGLDPKRVPSPLIDKSAPGFFLPMTRFIALLLVLFMGTAQAVIEAYEFESAQTETEYNQLIKELRCLVCQNQNLADSNAELAQDLRHQTYTMLSRGDSPAQVVEYMVARYGDFVIYRPQFKSSTYLLWLGPFLLLIIVLYLVIRKLRGSTKPIEVTQGAMAEAKNLLLREDAEK